VDAKQARPRRLDRASAIMAAIAAIALAATAWLRFRPAPMPEPPPVGSLAPLMKLTPVDAEPVGPLGAPGKVTWLTFWSVRSDPKALVPLEAVWVRLKDRPRFAMFAVAVEADGAAPVRSAKAAAGTTVPTYLADPATRRAFGVGRPPLHVLLDEEGRVAAVATGSDPATFDRLRRRAEALLQEIEPLGKERLASAVTSACRRG
jgi:hypothetical protein